MADVDFNKLSFDQGMVLVHRELEKSAGLVKEANGKGDWMKTVTEWVGRNPAAASMIGGGLGGGLLGGISSMGQPKRRRRTLSSILSGALLGTGAGGIGYYGLQAAGGLMGPSKGKQKVDRENVLDRTNPRLNADGTQATDGNGVALRDPHTYLQNRVRPLSDALQGQPTLDLFPGANSAVEGIYGANDNSWWDTARGGAGFAGGMGVDEYLRNRDITVTDWRHNQQTKGYKPTMKDITQALGKGHFGNNEGRIRAAMQALDGEQVPTGRLDASGKPVMRALEPDEKLNMLTRHGEAGGAVTKAHGQDIAGLSARVEAAKAARATATANLEKIQTEAKKLLNAGGMPNEAKLRQLAIDELKAKSAQSTAKAEMRTATLQLQRAPELSSRPSPGFNAKGEAPKVTGSAVVSGAKNNKFPRKPLGGRYGSIGRRVSFGIGGLAVSQLAEDFINGVSGQQSDISRRNLSSIEGSGGLPGQNPNNPIWDPKWIESNTPDTPGTQ